jgi:hypothetical protein
VFVKVYLETDGDGIGEYQAFNGPADPNLDRAVAERRPFYTSKRSALRSHFVIEPLNRRWRLF